MHIDSNKHGGFTLLELLVVIAIIGVLASVVIFSIDVVRSRARDTQRIANIRELQQALELFHTEHGRYPVSNTCGGGEPNNHWCNSAQYENGRWLKDWGSDGALVSFIPQDPQDPSQTDSPDWRPADGGTYFYYGQKRWYMIVFGVENYPHDLESRDGVKNCGGGTYHYGSNKNGIITIGVSCK